MSVSDLREMAGARCRACAHRVVWHHDERGCQYHGNGANRCPCRMDSDTTVARIVEHALSSAGQAFLAEHAGTRQRPVYIRRWLFERAFAAFDAFAAPTTEETR